MTWTREDQGAAMDAARRLAVQTGQRSVCFFNGRCWEGGFAWSDHWIHRKGALTVRLADAGAQRRYVAAGTDRLSELLAEAVGQA